MRKNLKTLSKFISLGLVFIMILTLLSIYASDTKYIPVGNNLSETGQVLTSSIGCTSFVNVYAEDDNSSKSEGNSSEQVKNSFKGLHGALLGNSETGAIYFVESADDSVPIASLTKLMTYLLVKEAIDRGDISANDIVKISREAKDVAYPYGRISLKDGEKVPLADLMDAMLVVSSNESAVALACHVAGSEAEFADLMNKRAEELGLASAHFYTSSGLPYVEAGDVEEISKENRMSARDLFVLGSFILQKYPEITEITSQKSITLPEFNFSGKNTNSLIYKFKNVDGLKTGYTEESGRCMIFTQTEKVMWKKQRLLGIILGAESVEERNKKAEILYYMGKENGEKALPSVVSGVYRVSIPDKNPIGVKEEGKNPSGLLEWFSGQKLILKIIEIVVLVAIIAIVFMKIFVRATNKKRRGRKNTMGERGRNKTKRRM